MQFFPQDIVCDFIGATLLLPCVSSANVGQLTIDLIIATLKLPCVGQLESTSVLPSAGFDAFDHQPGQVALSLQLFAHLGQQPKPLYILQQRAPAAKGCQLQFAQDLAQWVSGAEFGEVILAASLDATLKQDRQISTQSINFISADTDKAHQCRELGLEQLEAGLMADLAQQRALLPPWTLIEALLQQNIMPLCLVAFASEGNNAPDAVRVADAVNRYLKLVEPQLEPGSQVANGAPAMHVPWLPPMSWQCLFGSAARAVY
ncbi:hypothetical protein ABBQ38_009213 [Trebouxia sp. C0009 RCD-2024]